MQNGTKTQANAFVVNDVQNNYSDKLPISSKWYTETELNSPSSNVANYAFVPVNEAITGHDYLWTLSSTL